MRRRLVVLMMGGGDSEDGIGLEPPKVRGEKNRDGRFCCSLLMDPSSEALRRWAAPFLAR